VFENRVLRRIFGPKRDAMMGGWRKLHNEELHDLYSSPSILKMIKSRKMRWPGHVWGNGRWVYNIKMDLLEIGWGDVDCTGLVQDRDKWRALTNAIMNLRVP
jgi:hypothetical protein